MEKDLVELEQKALAARNSGNLKQAAELYSAIIEENPDYEHGYCFYNLAGCYEVIGELEKAEASYLRALEYNPEDSIFLGGHASFLYLHGDPTLAFEAYLKLWKLEKSLGYQAEAEKTMLGLRELSKRLRLTPEEFTQRLEAP